MGGGIAEKGEMTEALTKDSMRRASFRWRSILVNEKDRGGGEGGCYPRKYLTLVV